MLHSSPCREWWPCLQQTLLFQASLLSFQSWYLINELQWRLMTSSDAVCLTLKPRIKNTRVWRPASIHGASDGQNIFLHVVKHRYDIYHINVKRNYRISIFRINIHFLIMRPSSLGGGRILRRTLSVRLSVCPSVIITERHVAPPSELQWHTCTFRHALRAAYRTAISAAQILVLYHYKRSILYYIICYFTYSKELWFREMWKFYQQA